MDVLVMNEISYYILLEKIWYTGINLRNGIFNILVWFDIDIYIYVGHTQEESIYISKNWHEQQ